MAVNFKYKRLRWWNLPVPLFCKKKNGDFERMGWIWNRPAYIVKNIYHGWIAFVEDQTEDRLSYLETWSCKYCGGEITYDKKDAIVKYVKEKGSAL